MSILESIERGLFVIGAILLLSNAFGLISSLRNEGIYQEDTMFPNDIVLTQEQLYDVVDKEPVDTRSDVREVNQAINNGIAHYWDDVGISTYNLRVPFSENYLLNIASYVNPKSYLKYEFMDYRRAIERGVGLCSQHAIILTEIFTRAGIASHMVRLSGHVVTTALVDERRNEWWIVDPDYGVVVPYSLDAIQDEPGIIASFYLARGYDEKTILELEDFYASEGNEIVSGNGAQNYDLPRYNTEKAAYLLIWAIPVLCVLPLLAHQYIGGRNHD